METMEPLGKLPESVYVIAVHVPFGDDPIPLGPSDVQPMPLILNLAHDMHFVVVFGERERAEEFMISPAFDVPGIIKELAPEQFVRLLEGIRQFDLANYVLVDPPFPLPEDPMKLQMFELEVMVEVLGEPSLG